MRRREFVAVFGGTALWPLAGHTQQPERMRRVGVLVPFPENDPLSHAIVTAFAQALGRLGWNVGGNIQIDYRFAAGDPALFKTYAAELIGLSPDAILASTPQAVAAFRQQTRTIPIVFVLVIDPVGLGFVQTIAAWRQHYGVHRLRSAGDGEMASAAQGGCAGGYEGRRHF